MSKSFQKIKIVGISHLHISEIISLRASSRLGKGNLNFTHGAWRISNNDKRKRIATLTGHLTLKEINSKSY